MTLLFDVDGEGAIQPLGDGLLIVRYFAGYRGDLLITGVIFPSAVRTTAEDIEGYLSSIYGYWDVDGDGDVTWGDVTMILRYMFGFTGDTLVDGCVAAGASRGTAAEIEAYLAQFTTA